MADHLSHNLYTAPGPELSEIAAGLRAERPLETARRIMATTHDSLRYVRGRHLGAHLGRTRPTPTAPACARTSRTWPWP